MRPQGTHRMEVDGIMLSRQGLECLRAQGLGLPQQGHILWAAEGQAGKAASPAGKGRGVKGWGKKLKKREGWPKIAHILTDRA